MSVQFGLAVFILSIILSYKPGGIGVAIRAPKPQVRGSVLELDKVD